MLEPGTKIRENRQGAPVETVVEQRGNNIFTDCGKNYHITKIVRVPQNDDEPGCCPNCGAAYGDDPHDDSDNNDDLMPHAQHARMQAPASDRPQQPIRSLAELGCKTEIALPSAGLWPKITRSDFQTRDPIRRLLKITISKRDAGAQAVQQAEECVRLAQKTLKAAQARFAKYENVKSALQQERSQSRTYLGRFPAAPHRAKPCPPK